MEDFENALNDISTALCLTKDEEIIGSYQAKTILVICNHLTY